MSKIISTQELTKVSDSIRNYDVTVSMYGFKSALTVLRVHVGLGSNNHWQTIQDIVKKTYQGHATIQQVKFGLVQPNNKINWFIAK